MDDPELYSYETSAIGSRHNFIEFLNALLVDYQTNGKNWKNQTLGDFLEALATYTGDVDGYYHNMARIGGGKIDADSASWRVFADILRGATMYE